MAQLILLCTYNLTRYLSCSNFKGRLDPFTTNMCLDTLDLIEMFLPQWLQFFANRPEWQAASDLVSHEEPDNSWCWDFAYHYIICSFSYLLVERTWKQKLQGEATSGKILRRISPPCPPPPPGCPVYPPHPSSSPPSPLPNHHPPSSPPHPPPSPPTSGGLEGL